MTNIDFESSSPYDVLADELGKAVGRIEREILSRVTSIGRETDLKLASLISDLERREAERELRLVKLELAINERVAALRDGRDGKDGETGAIGPEGRRGDPGIAGESIAGPQGPAGAQGPAGLRGERGADGLTVTGPIGPRGEVGPVGLTGEIGPEGPQG